MLCTPCSTATLCCVGAQTQGSCVHGLSRDRSQHRCSVWCGNCAMGQRPQGGLVAQPAGSAAAAQRRSGRPHHCSGASGFQKSAWIFSDMATLTNVAAPGLPPAQQRNMNQVKHTACTLTTGCHSVRADGSMLGEMSRSRFSSMEVRVGGWGGSVQGLLL